jgi:hypothetical protein
MLHVLLCRFYRVLDFLRGLPVGTCVRLTLPYLLVRDMLHKLLKGFRITLLGSSPSPHDECERGGRGGLVSFSEEK